MKTNILLTLSQLGITALCLGQTTSPPVDPNGTHPAAATPSSSGSGDKSSTPLIKAAPFIAEQPLSGSGIVLKMKDGAVVIGDVLAGSPAAADNNLQKGGPLLVLAQPGITAVCLGQTTSPPVDPNGTHPAAATPSSSGSGDKSSTPLIKAAPFIAEQPLSGVGIVLRMKDGAVVIDDVLAGSSAAADNNIHKGDRLVAVVAGPEQKWVPVQGMKLGDVVAVIRGKAGSVARLVMTSAHENREREVRLVRESLDLTSGLVSSAGASPSNTPLRFTELAMTPNSAGTPPLNDQATRASDLIRAAKLVALKQHLEDTNRMLLESTRATQLADRQDRDKRADQESKLESYLKSVEARIKILMTENSTPTESPLPADLTTPRPSMQP